jgi:hypothetical protein
MTAAKMGLPVLTANPDEFDPVQQLASEDNSFKRVARYSHGRAPTFYACGARQLQRLALVSGRLRWFIELR